MEVTFTNESWVVVRRRRRRRTAIQILFTILAWLPYLVARCTEE